MTWSLSAIAVECLGGDKYKCQVRRPSKLQSFPKTFVSPLFAKAYQDSVAGAFIFLAISVVFAALMWWLEGKSRCDRKLSDVDHKAHALEVEEEESNP